MEPIIVYGQKADGDLMWWVTVVLSAIITGILMSAIREQTRR